MLGNHELNILLKEVKHDNHWFFGEEWSLTGEGDPITPAVLANDAIRQTVSEFFKTLPLILEREDVRVVHACWDDHMVKIARQSSDVLALYEQFQNQIETDHRASSHLDNIDRGLEHQNRNPVKVLTSGKERRVQTPFEASGILRYEQRIRWWEDYRVKEPLCVFGHYSIPDGNTLVSGPAYCADFGVAKRWEERIQPDFDGTFRLRLAAVRLPERRVMFDNGHATGAT